jgi:hypothetical protein
MDYEIVMLMSTGWSGCSRIAIGRWVMAKLVDRLLGTRYGEARGIAGMEGKVVGQEVRLAFIPSSKSLQTYGVCRLK